MLNYVMVRKLLIIIVLLISTVVITSVQASKNNNQVRGFANHMFGPDHEIADAAEDLEDTDQDGFSDYNENLIGTDPFDSQSHPTLADNAYKILAYWPLNTNAIETLGSGLDGTLKNGARFSDSAVWLDGRNDYVSFGNDKTLSVTGSISVCAWIKPEKRRVKMRLWGKYQIEDSDRAYCAFLSADRLWLFLSGDGSPCFGQTIFKFTVSRIAERYQWCHVAMTWNSQEGADGLLSYADGKRQAMLTLTDSDISSLRDSAANLTVGAYDIKEIKLGRRKIEVVNNSFSGSMSQMVLCDAPLTDLEVKELYLLGREGDLLAYLEKDFDGDAIPDWWERKNFGDVSEAAEGDYDGDGLSNLAELERKTDPVNQDTDADGWNDGEEVEYGSDPLNGEEFPQKARVFGTVSCNGVYTGNIHVIAVTDSNNWASVHWDVIRRAGSYLIAGLPDGNYWFKSYLDVNYDGELDQQEPWGVYSNSGVCVQGILSNINITLNAQDMDHDGLADWWEMLLVDADAMDDVDKIEHLLPRMDFDGDGISNEDEYRLASNPADRDSTPPLVQFAVPCQTVRESMGVVSVPVQIEVKPVPEKEVMVLVQADGGSAEAGEDYEFSEQTVVFSSMQTNAVVMVMVKSDWSSTPEAQEDICLKLTVVKGPVLTGGNNVHVIYINDYCDDTDGDGMPDWWETKYFGSATDGDPFADPDGDGWDNLREYKRGGDPWKKWRPDSNNELKLNLITPLRGKKGQ